MCLSMNSIPIAYIVDNLHVCLELELGFKPFALFTGGFVSAAEETELLVHCRLLALALFDHILIAIEFIL